MITKRRKITQKNKGKEISFTRYLTAAERTDFNITLISETLTPSVPNEMKVIHHIISVLVKVHVTM